PYQRGDILGLANNSSGNQRQETIQAQTNSRVWFISGANIEQLSADRPEFAETLTVLANSQMMIRRLPMPWLEADEKVSLITRKHPIFLLFALTPPLLVFVIALFGLNFLQAQFAILALFGMVIAFLICAIWLLWNINNWANDYY